MTDAEKLTLNKRACELLGICWHEPFPPSENRLIKNDKAKCIHCNEWFRVKWSAEGFYFTDNPDSTTVAGKVELLRAMENHPKGKLFFASLIYGEGDAEAIDDDGLIERRYLTDKDTGLLLKAAVEWMEQQNARR